MSIMYTVLKPTTHNQPHRMELNYTYTYMYVYINIYLYELAITAILHSNT